MLSENGLFTVREAEGVRPVALSGPAAPGVSPAMSTPCDPVPPNPSATRGLIARSGTAIHEIGALKGLLTESAGPCRAMVAAPVHALTDDVLMRLLNGLEAGLSGDTPWQDILQVGLVTGRDASALARFRDRLTQSGDLSVDVVLRLDEAGHDRTLRSERRLSDGQWISARQPVDGEAALAQALPVTVLAVRTHGSEACAKGTAGLVYCGRTTGDVPEIAGDGGFACGRGFTCPRGPHPRSVAPMADVLMMAVCGGLRLGDSINHDAFGFALNFIDGPGRAFVSSIASNSGAPLAALAFLATLADGGTLGEAVLMANALPMLGGIDDPTYLLVGDPGHRPVSGATLPEARHFAALPDAFDAGDRHHLVLTVPVRLLEEGTPDNSDHKRNRAGDCRLRPHGSQAERCRRRP